MSDNLTAKLPAVAARANRPDPPVTATIARYAHLARDSIQTAGARITGSIGESLGPHDARDSHDAGD